MKLTLTDERRHLAVARDRLFAAATTVFAKFFSEVEESGSEAVRDPMLAAEGRMAIEVRLDAMTHMHLALTAVGDNGERRVLIEVVDPRPKAHQARTLCESGAHALAGAASARDPVQRRRDPVDVIERRGDVELEACLGRSFIASPPPRVTTSASSGLTVAPDGVPKHRAGRIAGGAELAPSGTVKSGTAARARRRKVA